MALMKVRLNSSEIVRLLKSDHVKSNLTSRASGIYQALPKSNGEKWVQDSGYSRDRAWAMVIADNNRARRAAADGAIQRALGGGR